MLEPPPHDPAFTSEMVDPKSNAIHRTWRESLDERSSNIGLDMERVLRGANPAVMRDPPTNEGSSQIDSGLQRCAPCIIVWTVELRSAASTHKVTTKLVESTEMYRNLSSGGTPVWGNFLEPPSTQHVQNISKICSFVLL